MKLHAITHQFVEYIPEALEDGILYVSVAYATVVHKCCCGCCREVVTPLSPTAWELRFNGKTVSLYPSLGSWTLPCQSHYWIRENRVIWARRWSKEEIAEGRAGERLEKDEYYGIAPSSAGKVPQRPKKRGTRR